MNRRVGLWLLLMAVGVLGQVGLGGTTRLTDSGLSITEWRPLLGVVPPLNDAEWSDAFEKYRQLPQYLQLKSQLSIAEFKSIFFWEWLHRLWGRVLGVCFAVPLIYFWRRGALATLSRRLGLIFILGGFQGVLGWFMVMSGLSELVYVSHLRLAAHFMFGARVVGSAGVEWHAARVARPAKALECHALGPVGLLTW